MPLNGISLSRLSLCDGDLVVTLSYVDRIYPFEVICGHRSREEQNVAFLNGKSKVEYPNSKHNFLPSLAVDIAPKVNGKLILANDSTSLNYQKELRQIYHFCGFVLAVFFNKGIKVKWGGDWDSDLDIIEKNFNDLYHFELIKENKESIT